MSPPPRPASYREISGPASSPAARRGAARGLRRLHSAGLGVGRPEGAGGESPRLLCFPVGSRVFRKCTQTSVFSPNSASAGLSTWRG